MRGVRVGRQPEAPRSQHVPSSPVRHLRRPASQQGDGITELLLELGMQLMVEPLTQPTSVGSRVPLVRWPTRDELVRAYNARTGLRKTKAVVEDRWALMADFHMDLLVWTVEQLRRDAYRPLRDTGEISLDHPAPIVALEAIAVRDLQRLIAEQSLPVVNLLAYLAARQPELAVQVRATLADTRRTWIADHVTGLARAGFVNRPDVPADDLVDIMAALGHGLATQWLLDPGQFQHDLARVGQVYASAVIGIVSASIAPVPAPGQDVPTMRAIASGVTADQAGAGARG